MHDEPIDYARSYEPTPKLVKEPPPRFQVVRQSDGTVMGKSFFKIASDRLATFLGDGFMVEPIPTVH
jgi:hypothetical protein